MVLFGSIMKVPTKVLLESGEVAVLDEVRRLLSKASRSERIREAVQEKLKRERARLREMQRVQAMIGYKGARTEPIFESIEGDGFADR